MPGTLPLTLATSQESQQGGSTLRSRIATSQQQQQQPVQLQPLSPREVVVGGNAPAAQRLDELWSAMPLGRAAATSADHVERKPQSVLFGRKVSPPPSRPVVRVVKLAFYALGVATAVAYAVYFLAVSRTSDRYVGIPILVVVAAVALGAFRFLPSQRCTVSARSAKRTAARAGSVLRFIKLDGSGDAEPQESHEPVDETHAPYA